MGKLTKKGRDRFSTPPYIEDYECPVCEAHTRLVPGDEFRTSRGTRFDGDELIYECAGCRNIVSVPIENANRFAEAVVVISYRRYAHLAALERQGDAVDVLMRKVEMLGGTICDIAESLEGMSGAMASLSETTTRAVFLAEDLVIERDAPRPIAQLGERRREPERRRPQRAPALRGVGADDEETIPLFVGGVDPRGNFNPDIEEQEDSPVVRQGGRGGRPANAMAVEEADE